MRAKPLAFLPAAAARPTASTPTASYQYAVRQDAHVASAPHQCPATLSAAVAAAAVSAVRLLALGPGRYSLLLALRIGRTLTLGFLAKSGRSLQAVCFHDGRRFSRKLPMPSFRSSFLTWLTWCRAALSCLCTTNTQTRVCTAQHSTAQHSTAQHSTAHRFELRLGHRRFARRAAGCAHHRHGEHTCAHPHLRR